jgi:hypothetical protein
MIIFIENRDLNYGHDLIILAILYVELKLEDNVYDTILILVVGSILSM